MKTVTFETPSEGTKRAPTPPPLHGKVLARWSDDGWFYYGTVQGDRTTDRKYMVKDVTGHTELINEDDLIPAEWHQSIEVRLNSSTCMYILTIKTHGWVFLHTFDQ